jgi:DNA (cytosine-5)-methyltransferase 1
LAEGIVAIDLFCGAGGLTLGLERAGVKVAAGVDLDDRFRWAYEKNSRSSFLHANVARLSAEDLKPFYARARVRVLAGCAPCQPFSTYGRTRSAPDDRWALLKSFARIVSELRPDVVTMENVPGLRDHEVFDRFVSSLHDNGYGVGHDVVDCANFGVPQHRRRLVLVGVLQGRAALPRSTSSEAPSTVRDAIGHLSPLRAGETDPRDPLHVASRLSPLNMARIRASQPGGTWRDWPEDLRAACHRRGTGRTYPSVYGRMRWDEPAPTITTQCYGFGSGRFGHPEQDRAISLREAALLQSFPPDWQLFPQGTRPILKAGGTAIGNAVPPKLGEAIGRAILRSVEEAPTAAIS